LFVIAFLQSAKESSMSAPLRSIVLILWIGALWIGALSYGSNTTVQGETLASERIHFVLAGDSTVTEDSGWGIGFASLLSDRAYCTNLAKGGRSSRSFRDEGWWQKCLDLKPNYLLIQFGHNDQPGKGPARESAHDGAFREHLKRYVDEARAAGIQPILITSLTRRKWNRDDKIEPTLAEYALATTLVAKEKSVPLIDLHHGSIQQCEQIGPTAFRAFEPMKVDGADHTHLNREGSLAVGPIVVGLLLKELPNVSFCFADDKVKAAMVPQPYATKIQRGRLDLEESESSITMRSHGKPMLVYNKQSPPVPSGIDPVYHRSGFLHPIHSPAGQVVTATFPADHAHQHGVFTAWVKTSWNQRSIDFWNLAGGTGRVLHQRVISTFEDGDSIGFEVDLIHRAEESPVVDILRERWKVSAIPTDGTYHAFEIQTVQHAQTDIPLIVQEYHYGGMALRGPVAWLNPDKARTGQHQSSMVNDLGSDRMKGNHEPAKWVCMTGLSDGNPVSICALSHPSNFRAPQTARLHPTKPYFVFSPCVQGKFVIDRDQPYSGRYKFLVTDTVPNREWLNDQWKHWVGANP
jgi:lysophospholipase L1-like esterase